MWALTCIQIQSYLIGRHKDTPRTGDRTFIEFLLIRLFKILPSILMLNCTRTFPHCVTSVTKSNCRFRLWLHNNDKFSTFVSLSLTSISLHVTPSQSPPKYHPQLGVYEVSLNQFSQNDKTKGTFPIVVLLRLKGLKYVQRRMVVGALGLIL